MERVSDYMSTKYGKRLGVILLDLLIVILSFIGFHGSELKPVETAVWVLAAVCFVRLGMVLHLLRERDEVQP